MPHVLKKLWRNLRVFPLINVWWVDVFCTLTICLTCSRCIKERQEIKWILSMRIDSAECFHSCTAIPNFAQKTSCIATTGAEAFKIAYAHWMCLCLCIVNKLHCCVILPGNNEGEINIWISYYWNHEQNKEMKIITFKDATYAVAKTMQKIVRLPDTAYILIRNQYMW